MTLKAILFDIDQTMVDFLMMKHKSCDAALDAMIAAGLRANKVDARRELFLLYDRYGIEYKNIFEKLLKKINGVVDYRIMTHGIIAYRKIKESTLFAYPGTMEVLKELKKSYKLAVVTDAPLRKAWYRLVALGIDNLFDVVVTVGDAKQRKNTTTPFTLALKKLGVKASEALMVGDRQDLDILTAQKMGITTVFARYGVTYKDKPVRGSSGADAEIDDIKELPSIISSLR